MNWLVTIPKTIKWEDYLAEIAHAAKNNESLYYSVRSAAKVQPGDKLYVVWNGKVRGYMNITVALFWPSGFTCSYTGKVWGGGWYIERRGKFYETDGADYKGFRGIRLISDKRILQKEI